MRTHTQPVQSWCWGGFSSRCVSNQNSNTHLHGLHGHSWMIYTACRVLPSLKAEHGSECNFTKEGGTLKNTDERRDRGLSRDQSHTHTHTPDTGWARVIAMINEQVTAMIDENTITVQVEHSMFDIFQPLNCRTSTFHYFKERKQNCRQQFHNVTFVRFRVRKGECTNKHATCRQVSVQMNVP